MKIKDERGCIIDVSEEEALQRLRKRNAEDIVKELFNNNTILIIDEKHYKELYSKIADLEAKLLKFTHRISDQNEEILKTKQQLAEKDQAIEGLQEINKSLGQTCNNDAKEIERLREKENLLNLIADGYYTPTNIVKRQIREQNQTAIAELEKVRTCFGDYLKGLFWNDTMLVGKVCNMVNEIIDQQIKSLKGE